MRAEDKELEGPELEREERTHEQAEHEEEELPVLAGEQLQDVELAHRSVLFEALRLVIAGENINVSLLYLPQREAQALEALQAAVTGRDSVGEFMFAEDRSALLEQALAVLQENVTHGQPEQLAELHAKFDELSGQVAELRDQLVNLEDAQEEIEEWHAGAHKAVHGDAAPPANAAPAAADAALDGPERPVAPKPPSTLSGPERPEPPKPPTSLVGDALPEVPRRASTLDGELLPEEPKPPSTLGYEENGGGDGGGDGAAAKKPWWRKPFG